MATPWPSTCCRLDGEEELNSADWRLPGKQASVRRIITARRSSRDARWGSGQSPAMGLGGGRSEGFRSSHIRRKIKGRVRR
jgi:hypothetical protein